MAARATRITGDEYRPPHPRSLARGDGVDPRNASGSPRRRHLIFPRFRCRRLGHSGQSGLVPSQRPVGPPPAGIRVSVRAFVWVPEVGSGTPRRRSFRVTSAPCSAPERWSSNTRRGRIRRRAVAWASKAIRPFWELLEERTLLATVNWIGASGGDWDVPSNWDAGRVPTGRMTSLLGSRESAWPIPARSTDSIHSLTTRRHRSLGRLAFHQLGVHAQRFLSSIRRRRLFLAQTPRRWRDAELDQFRDARHSQWQDHVPRQSGRWCSAVRRYRWALTNAAGRRYGSSATTDRAAAWAGPHRPAGFTTPAPSRLTQRELRRRRRHASLAVAAGTLAIRHDYRPARPGRARWPAQLDQPR